MIRLFFWFWYPAPQVGEEYIHVDDLNDPWREGCYRITKRHGNWYRMRWSNGCERSIHRSVLVPFYRKIGRHFENDDLPF